MPRTPKGYRGVDHLTIGSDIRSLLDSVLMPEQILGAESFATLSAVRAEAWYPIAMLLEPIERLDKVLGPSSLRRIGWSIFKLSHEEEIRRGASSARDIVYGIDGMYHRANRGVEIGGWSVLGWKPGEALLEKTTPHHCVMEEGILEAALRTLEVPAVIYQPKCFRRGDEACRFVISSHVTGKKWSGTEG